MSLPVRDFTIEVYQHLLQTLQQHEFQFRTFAEFLSKPDDPCIVLRHDVDARKYRSLEFAKIQHRFGIQGSYYFRMVPQSFDREVISEIAQLGHEIGYHYEDMDTARGDASKAITQFQSHLATLRELYPVTTICMHGSPLSRHDNRALWRSYDYRDYGVIGEPYYDVDFDKVLYLTDTGRSWAGGRFSVRDKVNQSSQLSFRSTAEIIACVQAGQFPRQALLTFHPQRWSDSWTAWSQEWVMQNAKNVIKRYWLVRSNKVQA